MSEKRRGLGRGLGALIPTSSEGKRPVDVFFPSPATETPADSAPAEVDSSTAAAGGAASSTPDALVSTPVVTVVEESTSGPADVDGLTSLSATDLAVLDAVSAGEAVEQPADETPTSGDVADATSTVEDNRAASDDSAIDVSRETVARGAETTSGAESTSRMASDVLLSLP